MNIETFPQTPLEDERLTTEPWLRPDPDSIPAFSFADSNIEAMYDPSSMAVRYQQIVEVLFNNFPEKAKILEQTMSGELLEEDLKNISSATHFLMNFLKKVQAGEEPFDRTFVMEALYENRTSFFPQAMQLLSGKDMGKLVTSSHRERDPLKHICEATASLVESLVDHPDLDLEIVSLEIIAIMLHDFGKLHNPKDPSHASGSLVWAKKWIDAVAAQIPEMARKGGSAENQSKYSVEEAQYILQFLIQFHDLAGFVDAKKLTLDQATKILLSGDFIPNEQLLLSLSRIQNADMSAIPGMRSDFKAGNRQVLLELMQRVHSFRAQSGFEEGLLHQAMVDDSTVGAVIEGEVAAAIATALLAD